MNGVVNSRTIPGPAFACVADMIGSDVLLDINEFAAIAGIHHRTFRKVVGRGVLQYIQVSPRRKVIPTKQVTAELAEVLAIWAEDLTTFRESQIVYFIRAGADGPVKIGIASDLERRISELQKNHYEELDAVACCQGGLSVERAYHRRFAEHRIRGEWFHAAPEILAEIERLQGEAA